MIFFQIYILSNIIIVQQTTEQAVNTDILSLCKDCTSKQLPIAHQVVTHETTSALIWTPVSVPDECKTISTLLFAAFWPQPTPKFLRKYPAL